MLTMLLTVISLALALPARQPGTGRPGSSPQLAIDGRGTVRMVFGRRDTIFVAASRDTGRSFGPSAMVAVVPGMHLGNTRGPTIASSRDRSVILAIAKGDIIAFELDHSTGRSTRVAESVNDSPGSAAEGLATVAADDANGFHAVWLDLREGRQNQIYTGAVPVRGAKRTPNRLLYASPDGHVCECCRPSIAMSGRSAAVMFRNWIDGARDMYLVTSADGGQRYSPARKLGSGSWKLEACPMDGGAVAVDANGTVATVWRRELSVYLARPGEREISIGQGRAPMLSRAGGATYVVWQEGSTVRLEHVESGSETTVGEGRLPQVLALPGGGAIVAWERDGSVYVRRM